MQNTPGNYVSRSFVMPLYILWMRARATRFYHPWRQNTSAFIQKDELECKRPVGWCSVGFKASEAFHIVSFPPWHPWISHITSYHARQAEANLAAARLCPPRLIFMALVVSQSAHVDNCLKTQLSLLNRRRSLCFSIIPRENRRA